MHISRSLLTPGEFMLDHELARDTSCGLQGENYVGANDLFGRSTFHSDACLNTGLF
jgi:hypothetical protein